MSECACGAGGLLVDSAGDIITVTSDGTSGSYISVDSYGGVQLSDEQVDKIAEKVAEIVSEKVLERIVEKVLLEGKDE
jgi:hypothetical protein